MTEKIIKIAWFGKHVGEEPPLVGNKNQGAGGIFFSGCNLRCVFCQNFQISQQRLIEKKYSIEELADIMLSLQKQKAVNIDLVTPTIWLPYIKKAIIAAKKRGLIIPIVWNSNAYEKVETLKQMEKLVDIYLPDFKYGDDEIALKYSGIKNYTTTATNAIKEMLRQVGHLKTKNNIAYKGIILRHLVLPNNTKNSLQVLEQTALIDKNIHLSLMNQYYPLYKAADFKEINQCVDNEEFNKVCKYALNLGFKNGWVQEKDSSRVLIPNFALKKPF
ncbi:MAG: radical SAM protein [Patescibacteria group bacterium]|nr:radical SAM protein [Patescibacteria group bacterium]MDD5164847.1 radical SAM protein [Patescibacteria group bacterium]MDD5534679.1 radical SAM protein [Patescibacteria group bacterium]